VAGLWPIGALWRPSVLWRAASGARCWRLWIAGGRCERQVNGLPLTAIKIAALLCRWQPRGLAERSAERSEERQIDYPACLLQTCSACAAWWGDCALAWPDLAASPRPRGGASTTRRWLPQPLPIDSLPDLDQAVNAKDLRMSWEQQLTGPHYQTNR